MSVVYQCHYLRHIPLFLIFIHWLSRFVSSWCGIVEDFDTFRYLGILFSFRVSFNGQIHRVVPKRIDYCRNAVYHSIALQFRVVINLWKYIFYNARQVNIIAATTLHHLPYRYNLNLMARPCSCIVFVRSARSFCAENSLIR